MSAASREIVIRFNRHSDMRQLHTMRGIARKLWRWEIARLQSDSIEGLGLVRSFIFGGSSVLNEEVKKFNPIAVGPTKIVVTESVEYIVLREINVYYDRRLAKYFADSDDDDTPPSGGSAIIFVLKRLILSDWHAIRVSFDAERIVIDNMIGLYVELCRSLTERRDGTLRMHVGDFVFPVETIILDEIGYLKSDIIAFTDTLDESSSDSGRLDRGDRRLRSKFLLGGATTAGSQAHPSILLPRISVSDQNATAIAPGTLDCRGSNSGHRGSSISLGAATTVGSQEVRSSTLSPRRSESCWEADAVNVGAALRLEDTAVISCHLVVLRGHEAISRH